MSIRWAVQSGSASLVSLLLEHGAAIDGTSGGEGGTPLHEAAARCKCVLYVWIYTCFLDICAEAGD